MSNEDLHRMRRACARGFLQAFRILAGISPSEVAESAFISSIAPIMSSSSKSIVDMLSED